MNKLEEYKRDVPQIFTIPKEHQRSNIARDAFIAGHEMGHDNGFDAAIALDLPVKFAEWKELNCHWYKGMFWLVGAKDPLLNGKEFVRTNGQLYRYWLDNIFE